MPRLTASALVMTSLALCAAPVLAAEPHARHAAPDTPPAHRIFALNRQGGAAPLSFEQLLAELGSAEVVICGEYHDDPETHKMELALLRAYAASKVPDLAQRGTMNWASAYIDRKFALSMEMFERDVQPVVDNYVSGNPRSPTAEQDFLRASRPWGNYQTDYRPLVEFARTYKLQVVAANSPTALARRVAKEGLEPVLASLGADERGWLAEQTSAPKDGYWQRFLEFMGGAGDGSHGGGMTEDQIYGYYQAQCLKDDTMAESIAGYLHYYGSLSGVSTLQDIDSTLIPPPVSVFQVNGSFHSDYGYGVAQRCRERKLDVLTIAIRPIPDFTPVSAGGSLDPQGETLADGTPVADFVVFVPAPPAEPGARAER